MITADQIIEHIAKHLKWDASLKGSRITVDYIGRTAILEGTVPNLIAHSMAQRDALNIPGVDSVENRLTVKFDHNHPNKTDKELQADVQKVLECTSPIEGKKVQVSVMDGIVTLKGTTDSYWKKSRIEDLASSVEGILEISNQIKVLPEEKSPDSSIKKDIVEALSRMEVEELNNIKVEVKDGKVTLSGPVPTWSISFDIEDTARYTSGVVEVKNLLSVE
jgi:osmotically-inducible protein OsmY